VKSLSLGYQSLLADLYWIRAVQYYGRREEAARRQVRYKNLAALLDITTTLDPQMMDVYRAGSSFLAEPEPVGAGQPEESLKLLDKGIGFYPMIGACALTRDLSISGLSRISGKRGRFGSKPAA